MSTHVELESTRSVALELAPHVWGWEIPSYLFLGGVVAGLMLTVSLVVLLLGSERVTPAMRRALILAPVLLSLGMGALFIDLSYKLHVFRFYTAIEPTAPMSLGSWVLLCVYPVQVAMVPGGMPTRWASHPRCWRPRAAGSCSTTACARPRRGTAGTQRGRGAVADTHGAVGHQPTSQRQASPGVFRVARLGAASERGLEPADGIDGGLLHIHREPR
jgi:hypothetical protein